MSLMLDPKSALSLLLTSSFLEAFNTKLPSPKYMHTVDLQVNEIDLDP